jgi:hypothetical protein
MPLVPRATDLPGRSKFLIGHPFSQAAKIAAKLSQAASHCGDLYCKKARKLLLPQFGTPANRTGQAKRNVLFPGMNDIFSKGRTTPPWPR